MSLEQPPGYPNQRPRPDMLFRGRPARVLVELDMGDDRKLTIPVGDLANYKPGPGGNYGTLSVAINNEFHRRLYQADRDVKFAGLDR